jgi:hypothetical protein
MSTIIGLGTAVLLNGCAVGLAYVVGKKNK